MSPACPPPTMSPGRFSQGGVSRAMALSPRGRCPRFSEQMGEATLCFLAGFMEERKKMALAWPRRGRCPEI